MSITPNHAEIMQHIKSLAEGRKVVLNVGCGEDKPGRIHAEFKDEAQWFELRLDMNASVKPHILGDLSDLSMLPDGAVDAVLSSHNIEHLFAHQVSVTLKGFFRVLKFGGQLILLCPDLQTIAAFIAQGKLETTLYTSPSGAISALDMVYGLSKAIEGGNPFMAHRTGFTHETLAMKLKEAGFSNLIITRDRFDMEVVARKLPMNHAQRRDNVQVKLSERFNPREAVAVTVDNLVQLPHPGLTVRGKMADELDIPPV